MCRRPCIYFSCGHPDPNGTPLPVERCSNAQASKRLCDPIDTYGQDSGRGDCTACTRTLDRLRDAWRAQSGVWTRGDVLPEIEVRRVERVIASAWASLRRVAQARGPRRIDIQEEYGRAQETILGEAREFAGKLRRADAEWDAKLAAIRDSGGLRQARLDAYLARRRQAREQMTRPDWQVFLKQQRRLLDAMHKEQFKSSHPDADG